MKTRPAGQNRERDSWHCCCYYCYHSDGDHYQLQFVVAAAAIDGDGVDCSCDGDAIVDGKAHSFAADSFHRNVNHAQSALHFHHLLLYLHHGKVHLNSRGSSRQNIHHHLDSLLSKIITNQLSTLYIFIYYFNIKKYLWLVHALDYRSHTEVFHLHDLVHL